MSPQSADVVRKQFEAFAAGGVDAAAEFWHPDIEWRAVEGAADDVGVMRGANAVRGYYQDWIDTFEDLSAEVEEVIVDAGDRVAVAVRNSGRGRTSGAAVGGRYYVACTVEEGLIRSGREYATREEAMRAVVPQT